MTSRRVVRQRFEALTNEVLARHRQNAFDAGATHGYECGWKAHRAAMQAALRRIVNKPPFLGEPLLKPAPKRRKK
jgi:hypothetical protein